MGKYLARLEGTTLLPEEQTEGPINESHIYTPEKQETSDDDASQTYKGMHQLGHKKCKQLIDKTNLLVGRSPPQPNTYVDNVNKNKTKLPSLFSYLNMYNILYNWMYLKLADSL